MAKKAVKLDPNDSLIVGEVGPWATEKHDRLRKYIEASRGPRAKFLRPNGTGGASYIELYAGAGRSLITGTNQIIDGSAVVAFKAGQASGHPFSETTDQYLRSSGRHERDLLGHWAQHPGSQFALRA